MNERIKVATEEINTYNEQLDQQDLVVQTAKDANQALLDEEPTLKRELDRAEAAVQESKNRLKELMVFPRTAITDSG